MVYEWKTPLYKVSAQTAGEHIEELDATYGEVTPRILLEDSRPDDALLHPLYEWDDEKAAEKYRLHQSKNILGNLVIVSVSDNQNQENEIEPVRAFVSVNDRNEKASYRPTVVAMSDEETKYQVLKNASAELKMFERKYRNLLDVGELLKNFLRGLAS